MANSKIGHSVLDEEQTMSQYQRRQARPDRLDIGSQHGGSIFNVIGDILFPGVELPRWGPAKWLTGLGLLTFLAGFVSFAYAVVRFLLAVFQAVSSESVESPDLSFMTPWMPLGIGLAIAGVALMLMAAAGTAMLGRRDRGERDMSDQRRQRPRGGIHVDGGQHAGRDINNVEGDVWGTGDSYDDRSRTTVYVAGRDLRIVRNAVDAMSLPTQMREYIDQRLAEAETEASKAAPNKRQIASRLDEVTETLSDLGELQRASGPVIAAFRRLAQWVGPIGLGVLQRLPL